MCYEISTKFYYPISNLITFFLFVVLRQDLKVNWPQSHYVAKAVCHHQGIKIKGVYHYAQSWF